MNMSRKRSFAQFEGEPGVKIKRRKRLQLDAKHGKGHLEDDMVEGSEESLMLEPISEEIDVGENTQRLSVRKGQELLDQCRTDYARRLVQKLIALGISPDPKRFDQHFLVDESTVYDMVGAADIKAGDSILEIGPGPGQLTQALLATCREERAQLTAVEIDPNFEAALAGLVASGLQLYWGDAIRKFREITQRKRINKIVANPPYRILEPLLAAIHTRKEIERAVLLLGKTYADHAVAAPSDPRGQFTVNSLYSQARFVPTIEGSVSRESFIPEPRTESAIVVLAKGRQGREKIALNQLATARIERPNVPVGRVLEGIRNELSPRRGHGGSGWEFTSKPGGTITLSTETLRQNIGSLSNFELQAVVQSLHAKN